MTLALHVTRLPHGRDLPLPRHETPDSAGLDLMAAVAEDAPIVLQPGERRLVPTGLILQIPPGHEGQVRPRSGLALRHGVTCLNAPGTVDADYRGEVGVILINHGGEPFTVTRGMRIAQLVVARYEKVDLVDTDVVSETTRGAGGFGSTGTGQIPVRTE